MAVRPGGKHLGRRAAPAAWAALSFSAWITIVVAGQGPAAADEPGRFGRLFRFGSGSTSTAAPPATPSEPSPPSPPAAFATAPEAGAPAPVGGPGTPTASPRIVPRPRVTRAITESDPILTRITLNRSDDGNVFGMFLQVYADGTILDTEGVHHVGQDALKPLVEALQAGDLYRVRGHCGAPATDYVESVQLIVYERSLGRLRAHAFSYSGNPQGCDNAIRHLHATLDNLQARIARPPAAQSATAAGSLPGLVPDPTPLPTPSPSPAGEPAPPPSGAASPTVIPLTGPS